MRVLGCVLCAFGLLAVACGGDDGPGGVDTVCPSGRRLSALASGYIHLAAVGDQDISVGVPRSEASARFFSALWAPAGETVALVGDQDSGILDPSCEPYDALSVSGQAVAWSPDGHRLLVARETREGGRVRLAFDMLPVQQGTADAPVELGSVDVAAAAESPIYAFDARWSADSRFAAIAVVTEEERAGELPGHIYVVDADATVPDGIGLGEIRDEHSFAWSPAGDFLAFADADPGVLVADATTGAVDRTDRLCQAGSFQGVVYFLWSPDGSAFLYPAFTSDDCTSELREVRLDTEVAATFVVPVPDSSSLRPPAWFADSRHIAHLSSDSNSLLWTDLETSVANPIATSEFVFDEFAFAPTWDRIAVLRGDGSAGGGRDVLLVADITDGAAYPAAEIATVSNLGDGSIAWSPDGHDVFIAGAPGVHVGYPDGAITEVEALEAAWSPDSAYLAIINPDHKLLVHGVDGSGLDEGRLMIKDAFELDWAP